MEAEAAENPDVEAVMEFQHGPPSPVFGRKAKRSRKSKPPAQVEMKAYCEDNIFLKVRLCLARAAYRNSHIRRLRSDKFWNDMDLGEPVESLKAVATVILTNEQEKEKLKKVMYEYRPDDQLCIETSLQALQYFFLPLLHPAQPKEDGNVALIHSLYLDIESMNSSFQGASSSDIEDFPEQVEQQQDSDDSDVEIPPHWFQEIDELDETFMSGGDDVRGDPNFVPSDDNDDDDDDDD